jgi:tetratricopeptide (TPR) repeat protein
MSKHTVLSRFSSAVLLLGLVTTLSTSVHAQRAELAQSIDELNSAAGPEVYTSIRKIWSLWGSTDPRFVEQALLDAGSSKRLALPAKAYARFLAAHARTRRGDPAGAKRAVAELGFVDEWLVVGPFDNEGKAGYDFEYGPETQFADPIVEGRAYSGKERAVRWRSAPNVFEFGWLDGGALFRPEQNICFYATTVVSLTARQARSDVGIWVGTSGAFKLFVNGKELLRDAAYRGHDVDRFGAVARLPAGHNRLTVKACGLRNAPIVSVRLSDAKGSPDPNLKATVSFDLTRESATNHGELRIVDAELGPVLDFERLSGVKRPTAATLEAYARYLVTTGADDPSTHQARDLAQRAATMEPTLERLLLAGELAEDYNQHRQWVEKAEALAAEQARRNDIDLVLARAEVEQSGLNWRDGFSYYERAGRIDPDNLVALSGRVSLLNRASMGQSALAILTEALERNPNSVTLLNMHASQLRALGRSSEADVEERRYSQFRFDDLSYITSQLDLALVRNERPVAEHWTDRLLQTHPDSLWAHSVAAKAYESMAQPVRAIATYRAALNLAPDDVTTLRALSDLHGKLEQTNEQVALLRQILEIRPQAKDIHEYLRSIKPEKPKQDEAYAWVPDRFLKERNAPPAGENRRTLLDLNVTTVFENGLSSQFRQVVFQPLSDSAAALSRNFIFGFQADTQRVQLRGARVFRADGRVDEAVETGIGAADNPAIATYTSARTYSVQFPRLEPGDVVELRYRIDDVAQRNELADYFGDLKYLQDNEPVGHAEYILITPKSRRLFVDKRGIPGLKTKIANKGEQRIYRFWAESLPAIHPEPAMPPWPEVLGFIHVSTFKDYDELGKWYWGLSQDMFDVDDETRKLAREITKGLTTDDQKVRAVYNWVIKNTRYVALEFGINRLKPRRCVQTVSRGWGDCKDKATVIVTLLKELGIDATIVIIRTQLRGMFESNVASVAAFDHAIAYVPSLDLYLDGTAEFTGSRELPAFDQQGLAILVNEGSPKVVKVPLLDPETNTRTRKISASVAADGSAKLDLDIEVAGSQAPAWRRRFHATATQRERVASDLSREFTGFQLEGGNAAVKVESDDYEKPFRLQVHGKSPAYARLDGEGLSLPVTTRQRLTEAYASLSTRTLPVAVPLLGTVKDVVQITLPPGYRVLSQPTDTMFASRFGKYSVNVEQHGRKVTVTSRITLNVTRVDPKDYQQWRAFCQGADAAMLPRLVVGK